VCTYDDIVGKFRVGAVLRTVERLVTFEAAVPTMPHTTQPDSLMSFLCLTFFVTTLVLLYFFPPPD